MRVVFCTWFFLVFFFFLLHLVLFLHLVIVCIIVLFSSVFVLFVRIEIIIIIIIIIGPWLLWIANGKSQVANRSMSVPMTLSDLEQWDARSQFFGRSHDYAQFDPE